MDSRTTLPVDGTFLEMLDNCFHQKAKVCVLVDEDGLSRMEGLIEHIYSETPDFFIQLEGARKVNLRNIVAVNGVFRAEYGEC